MIIGLLFFGWMATKYGKRMSIIISNLILMIGNFIFIFCDDKSTIAVALSITSLSYYAMSALILSLIPEIVSKSYISIAVVGSVMSHSLGKLFIGAMFYFTTNYQLVMLTSVVPFTVLFFIAHHYYY
jgi:MFS family permease